MNKNQFTKYCFSIGIMCSYSGKTRTMYIKGDRNKLIDNNLGSILTLFKKDLEFI